MKQLLLSFLCISFFFACEDPVENTSNLPRLDDLHLRDGITRIGDDSLAFVLFAPKKQSVYLIGDFNNWQTSDAYKMQKDGDRFWIKIGIPDKNKEYVCQYLIDNTIRIADPYSNQISDPWNDAAIPATIYPNLIPYPAGKTTEIAMVVSTKQDNYQWKVETLHATSLPSLVIYEILIRDFTEKRSIKGVQEKIPYLKELGVNAIELMPFNEFEANDSWGYNPSFYFATDKAYGTANDYKAFIDECHANNIAVIMDMVLNHSYGQSPLVRMYQNGDKVAADNPWYNVNSPNTTYSWGYDFNHESKYTAAFVDSINAFWLKEYKIDGFRFDFTKGFTNQPGDGQAYDPSRIAILERMTSEIRKRKKDALIIFEHLADNSEEKVLAENGILLWGNLNYSMNEATMGYGDEMNGSSRKGDLSWASYKQRGWNQPGLIAYMESHDEERIMFKNVAFGKTASGYDVKNLATGLKRTEAAAVILFSIPGPKMIWQFGELGYDFPLEGNGADRLGKKPIRWDYYEDANRKALYDVYAKMIDLRNNKAVFSTADYTIDLTANFKYIVLKSSGETVVAMANFDVIPVSKIVNFSQAGKWKDYFSGDEITISAATENIMLNPGEYRLYFSKE
ncbi:MAG: alpha-amylase [Dysgonamonadaceae bacterium]|jgi:1,4-alpha-glucan branching enzyme|nr:alpha-amylase [Dysgonamonadaceae bacterium]